MVSTGCFIGGVATFTGGDRDFWGGEGTFSAGGDNLAFLTEAFLSGITTSGSRIESSLSRIFSSR